MEHLEDFTVELLFSFLFVFFFFTTLNKFSLKLLETFFNKTLTGIPSDTSRAAFLTLFLLISYGADRSRPIV